MPDESFLQRWSRRKAEPEPEAPLPAVQPAPAATPDAAAPLPTLADAAALGAGSDYSAFVAQGVDASVRRLAMKKLFADPHFNLVDGLDIYMGDYNLASPVSEAMLAQLSHARSVFARIEDALDAVVADLADTPAIAPQAPPAQAPLPPPDQEVA